MKFSTKDVDNDIASGSNYAQTWHGAWWIRGCFDSHLNGEYNLGQINQINKGIIWYYFKGSFYSYKVTEMKVGGDENENVSLIIKHFNKLENIFSNLSK